MDPCSLFVLFLLIQTLDSCLKQVSEYEAGVQNEVYPLFVVAAADEDTTDLSSNDVEILIDNYDTEKVQY